jgi:hypothetical protein
MGVWDVCSAKQALLHECCAGAVNLPDVNVWAPVGFFEDRMDVAAVRPFAKLRDGEQVEGLEVANGR